MVLPFEFKNVEMEYESYRGTQVRLRSIPALISHLHNNSCGFDMIAG